MATPGAIASNGPCGRQPRTPLSPSALRGSPSWLPLRYSSQAAGHGSYCMAFGVDCSRSCFRPRASVALVLPGTARNPPKPNAPHVLACGLVRSRQPDATEIAQGWSSADLLFTVPFFAFFLSSAFPGPPFGFELFPFLLSIASFEHGLLARPAFNSGSSQRGVQCKHT